MSDGPHRSLKMLRHWKTVAEFADTQAFAPNEVGTLLPSPTAKIGALVFRTRWPRPFAKFSAVNRTCSFATSPICNLKPYAR